MSSTSHRQEKAVHYRPPTPDTIDDFAQDVCVDIDDDAKMTVERSMRSFMDVVVRIHDRYHNQSDEDHAS